MLDTQPSALKELLYHPIPDGVPAIPRQEMAVSGFSNAAQPSATPSSVVAAAREIQELEAKLAESQRELERLVEEARQKERATAKVEAERASHDLITDKLAQMNALIEQVSSEKQMYCQKVEHEVVMLSLAIAARILRREAHIDPLFLAGVVHIALQQVQEGMRCLLHIPSPEEEQWKEWLSQSALEGLQVTIVPGRLDKHECRLETESSAISFGIETQLAEIERGFLDLLQHQGSGIATTGRSR